MPQLSVVVRLIAIAVATLLPAVPAGAQRMAPTATLVEEVRIPTSPSLPMIGTLAAAADGSMIVTPGPRDGSVTAFDATGTRTLWELPNGRGNDKDFRNVRRIGFAGVNSWLYDPSYDQVAIVSPAGKILKSMERPALIRPTWSDRRKYPAFGDHELWAAYADNTLLVQPSDPSDLLATTAWDSTRSYLMRAGAGGVIQRVVASMPWRQGRLFIDGKEVRRLVNIPYAARPLHAVSPDGDRIVIVTPASGSGDGATVRMDVLDAMGQLLVRRWYVMLPPVIPPAAIDSALNASVRFGVGNKAPEEVRSLLRQAMPARFPAVLSVRVGRDHAIWLEIAAPDGGRVWAILDPSGTQVARLVAPPDFTVVQVTAQHAWGVQGVQGDGSAAVRYRVVLPGR
jgi:hypothetical protein